MAQKRVVLLSGWIGSGKDTLADYMVEKKGFKKYAIAATLKDYVAQEYDLDRKMLEDSNFKSKPLMRYPVKVTDEFALLCNGYISDHFKKMTGSRNTQKFLAKDNDRNLYEGCV